MVAMERIRSRLTTGVTASKPNSTKRVTHAAAAFL